MFAARYLAVRTTPRIRTHNITTTWLCTYQKGLSTSAVLCAAKVVRGLAAPSTRKQVKNRGSFYYKTKLSNIFHEIGLQRCGENGWPSWLINRFRVLLSLGYGSEKALRIVRDQLLKEQDIDTDEAREDEQWASDVEKLLDLKILSEACYALGHFLWNDTENFTHEQCVLAKYVLLVSVEAGSRRAHLDLWLLAQVMKGEAGPRTLKAIRDAAEKQECLDWRALQLYIDWLLKKSKSTPEDREVAFEQALQLNDLVEPGSEKSQSEPEDDDQKHALSPLSRSDLYVRPWELLRDAAIAYSSDLPQSSNERDRATVELKRSLRDGVDKYNSTDAAKDLTEFKDLSGKDLIPKYSHEWVALKTMAASACDRDSCRELGRYWLEKSGWYPCTNQPKRTQDVQTGRAALNWMLLAANLSVASADDMGARYLGVALVLRENGFAAEGLRWLRYGMDTLEKSCVDSQRAKQNAWKILSSLENLWEVPGFPRKAADLLGKPLLSPPTEEPHT